MAKSLLTLAVLMIALDASSSPCDRFRVTLLGTGTPRPIITRFGPSILVEAGAETLLFDVGRGSLQRLTQIGVPYAAITGVFLTHLHSDHVVGLPDLWLSGWLVSQRNVPLEVWGPVGTEEMVNHLREAYRYDLQIRVEDDKASPEGSRLIVKDIGEEVVLRRNGVIVTSFLVDHAPIKPAFGFRIDYCGHSLVLSGDTRKSANLIEHARGVDVLIHEVAAATADELQTSARARSVVAHHTIAREAAEVFSKARPGLAVYSHIVLRGNASEADIMRETRAGYRGPVVMGKDLMTIDVVTRTVMKTPRRRAA